MLEKLKSWLLNDQVFFSIIVVLVGIASFFLGRASITQTGSQEPVRSTVKPNVVIKESEQTAVISPVEAKLPVVDQTTAMLVGSKSGTKYHLLTCPGAKQIKEENKLFFASVAEATAAGYKPAANCPQLQ